jgi:hypothetical protein
MSFHRNAIRVLSGDHTGDAGAVPMRLGSDATRSTVSVGATDDDGGDGDAHAAATMAITTGTAARRAANLMRPSL